MRNLLAFLTLVFIFSCSSDNAETEPQTGNLTITVISKSDEPISGAIVTTTPATSEKTSGVSGIVSFNNIEPGTYTINVELPSDPINYTSSANVIAGETTPVFMEVGPGVLTPLPVSIDFLLESCYDRLKGEHLFDATGYCTYWGDIGADILYKNTNGSPNDLDIDLYNLIPSNGIILDVWEEHYIALRQANIGLDAIENDDFTSEQPVNENEVKAEFQFLRALLYFNLVKLFGNPVINTTADIDLNNPPPVVQGQEEAYNLIVADLTAAQASLKASGSNTRASLAASQALLGKVYLQMAGFPLQQTEKYALALAEFEKLEGHFSLETNYGDVFSLDNENSTTEVIFKIPFDGDGSYGSYWGPVGIAPQDYYEMASGFPQSFFPNPDNVMSPVTFPLDVSDLRFEQNVAPFKYENSTVVNEVNIEDWRPYKFKKAVDEAINFRTESFDFPYLRYADVLLMIAEAENAVNGPTAKAYAVINEVRRRAYGNSDNDIAPGLNQQDFLGAILEERRRELCFEGHRKDDLIRTQTLESVIDEFNTNHPQNAKNYESHKYVWPIPQVEIDFNPEVQQNQGY